MLQNHSLPREWFFLGLKIEGEFEEALGGGDEESAEEDYGDQGHEQTTEEVEGFGNLVD